MEDAQREEMRRSMMENANAEAAEAKEKAKRLQEQVNLLERENRSLKRDNSFFRNIIERLIDD